MKVYLNLKKGIKSFQFGNLEILASENSFKIPINPVGKISYVKIDIIGSDIPLPAMAESEEVISKCLQKIVLMVIGLRRICV